MALRRQGAIVTSALDYHLGFDGRNNVFADTRNDTENDEDDGIETSICYCDVKILHRQPFFLFLALGNMHRLPTKSQTRSEKVGQTTRKGC